MQRSIDDDRDERWINDDETHNETMIIDDRDDVDRVSSSSSFASLSFRMIDWWLMNTKHRWWRINDEAIMIVSSSSFDYASLPEERWTCWWWSDEYIHDDEAMMMMTHPSEKKTERQHAHSHLLQSSDNTFVVLSFFFRLRVIWSPLIMIEKWPNTSATFFQPHLKRRVSCVGFNLGRWKWPKMVDEIGHFFPASISCSWNDEYHA